MSVPAKAKIPFAITSIKIRAGHEWAMYWPVKTAATTKIRTDTMSPRIIPPNKYPRVFSIADRGGSSRSEMLPLYFIMIKELEGFIKALVVD